MKRGHTLIEVILSISIWAAGILLFVMMFSLGIKMMQSTDQKFEAYTIAEEKLIENTKTIGRDEKKLLELDGKKVKEGNYEFKFSIKNIEGASKSVYRRNPERLETIPESEYCSFYEIEETVMNENYREIAKIKMFKWVQSI
ncbi:MAG: hypothetical protein N4A40_02830 [Tissierellales bacterium]|jgi:type II secretory pathway component PulJ|nr:hypothetical protein [Tissierellales bacterium]